MATTMKTPGVYIQELDAFGNSVVPVPTAIPAFIGYTENTSLNGKSIVNKAVKVKSLTEFFQIFGSNPPSVQFNLTQGADGSTDFTLERTSINFRLYAAMKFFYQNGGGDCYVISTGAYDYSAASITDTTAFQNAIQVLVKETEPTMLVIPDLVEISGTVEDESKLDEKYANAYSLQQEMINHCGEMKNRVAILDIPGGFEEPLTGDTSVDFFRNSVSPTIAKSNSYAAAYYPWLHTTVYQSSEVSYKNIKLSNDGKYDVLAALLKAEFGITDANATDPKLAKIVEFIDAFTADALDDTALEAANAVFMNLSSTYQLIMNDILEELNLMAPSAAMAGIYTTVDNNEGVWIAPANVGVASTIKPAINIDHAGQEDLNMPVNGKSVCAIRAFTGRGNLVWGARTLDGNSNDWRYINVRRTLIYIEQSVEEACKAYVFAPNDAGTWIDVTSMISNFLTGLWKQGGLVGPKPGDAFTVACGLGSTMTGNDILNGIMRVTIKVAVSRPAEFIELTFQQQMQKG